MWESAGGCAISFCTGGSFRSNLTPCRHQGNPVHSAKLHARSAQQDSQSRCQASQMCEARLHEILQTEHLPFWDCFCAQGVAHLEGGANGPGVHLAHPPQLVLRLRVVLDVMCQPLPVWRDLCESSQSFVRLGMPMKSVTVKKLGAHAFPWVQAAAMLAVDSAAQASTRSAAQAFVQHEGGEYLEQLVPAHEDGSRPRVGDVLQRPLVLWIHLSHHGLPTRPSYWHHPARTIDV